MDATTEILKKMMDLCATRHRVLAHNLANADTPGFRRQDVCFRKALSAAIKSRDPAKLAKVTAEIRPDTSGLPGRWDGNNVSTQKELGSIAQNNLLYQLSAQALSGKLNLLRKAIKGG